MHESERLKMLIPTHCSQVDGVKSVQLVSETQGVWEGVDVRASTGERILIEIGPFRTSDLIVEEVVDVEQIGIF